MSDAYFVFPSDADRAENEDLNRVCEYVEDLQDELERLRALWEKETERAHVAEGELLKSRVRLVTIKQERDQLKVSLNSILDALDGVRKAPRRAGHQLNHPDPKAERDAWRKLNSACDQAISGSTAAHDAEVIDQVKHALFNEGRIRTCITKWEFDIIANQLRKPSNEGCELECGAHGTLCRCNAEQAEEVQP